MYHKGCVEKRAKGLQKNLPETAIQIRVLRQIREERGKIHGTLMEENEAGPFLGRARDLHSAEKKVIFHRGLEAARVSLPPLSGTLCCKFDGDTKCREGVTDHLMESAIRGPHVPEGGKFVFSRHDGVREIHAVRHHTAARQAFHMVIAGIGPVEIGKLGEETVSHRGRAKPVNAQHRRTFGIVFRFAEKGGIQVHVEASGPESGLKQDPMRHSLPGEEFAVGENRVAGASHFVGVAHRKSMRGKFHFVGVLGRLLRDLKHGVDKSVQRFL